MNLSNKVANIKKLDEQEEAGNEASGVSEYNIFYHEDDDIPTFTSSEETLHDFSRATPSTEVLIKDMSPATDVSSSTSKPTAKVNNCTLYNRAAVSTLNPLPPSKPPKAKTNRPVKTVPGKTKRAQHEKKVHVTKTKKPDMQSEQIRSGGVAAVKQVSERELARSVKLAWESCGQESSRSQTLGAFFLHGVDPTQDQVEDLAKLTNLHTDHPKTTFKLGKQTWCHSDGSTLEGNQKQVVEVTDMASPGTWGESNQFRSAELKEDKQISDSPPLTVRDKACPSTINPGFRDPYYDEDGNDSEPENERETFICSRLGSSKESMEHMMASRPGTAAARPDKEEEAEEEEMEREQEDCCALENLASELLASTVEFERCMTASRLEEEEEVGGVMGGADSKDVLLDDSLGEDFDVSRLQCDFDLFQRKMIDQDSD